MNNLVRSVTILIVSLLTATIGKAQTVSPVPAPTIITSAPYTISRPGYYQLGADLVYAGNGSTNDAIITINASNVTLDFGGHYISGSSNGTGSMLYGVYAYERGNLKIQNGTIAYCYEGVYLNGSGVSGSININQRVDNMLVSYCFFAGVYFNGVTNGHVTNSGISFIGGTTVSQDNGQAFGLAIFGGSGNQIDNNTVSTMTGSSDCAIYGQLNFSASGNMISNLSEADPNNSSGIYQANFAQGNTIANAHYGLLFCTKYANNLTSGCATPYNGGTAAGYNN